MDSKDLGATARNLRHARQQRTALSRFPGIIPEDLRTAYAVQRAMVDEAGLEIAGWKIGAIAEKHRARFPEERLIAPILEGTVVRNTGSTALDVEIPARGFVGVEAEICVRMGKDMPPRKRPYTAADAADAIAEAFVSIELLYSPIVQILELGPGAIIADQGINGGLIVGPSLKSWIGSTFSAVTVIGRQPKRQSEGVLEFGTIAEALQYAVNALPGKGNRPVRAGDLICTGALNGLHVAQADDTILTSFAGTGTIELRLVSERGRPWTEGESLGRDGLPL